MNPIPHVISFFDMSGTLPRIARIVHDYGEGKEINRAYRYNTDQGHTYLHVQVTKSGAQVINNYI
ncbi:MAG: hypothetical protein BWY93_01871 [Euryarchaeota archaeon ADurb.BinA087]|nr:MAG: hypothetical protein BWY93_01871 [Euryarchaeota archaeon ADurb.BinA087]